MNGYNRAVIMGRLGRDPETRSFQDGNMICTFSVAISEKWKDRNTGEKKERTDWINVVGRGRLAEIMSQYLKKGSAVLIEGKIRTRKWQNPQGQTQYATEIYADQMQMIGGASDNQQGGQQPQQHGNQQRGNHQQSQPDYGGDFDDDLPFFPYQKRWFA